MTPVSSSPQHTDPADAGLPPRQSIRPLVWLRQNLFNSWLNTCLTLLTSAAVIWALGNFSDWAFNEANWAVIPANLKVFFTGTYPVDQLWRVWLVLGVVMTLLGVGGGVWQGVLLGYVIGVAGILGVLAFMPLGQSQAWLGGISLVSFAAVGLGWKRSSWRSWTLWAWGPALLIIMELLLGGFGELFPAIDSKELTGLLLTLVLASAALILGFPVGVLLALGRANQILPVIRIFCTLMIELIRGVPLTTILFAAWLLVPLFLGGINVALIIRAEVGLILFTGVYVAEDVRGGLQSIPRGQVEAARALGMNAFQITALVTLPQALRVALPALVNEFLTLFKDTSLVLIIGMIELLGVARTIYNNSDWLGTHKEVLCFVGLIYFGFCYGMAFAAKQLEQQLGLGKR